METKIACPKCQHEFTVNPAKLLGGITSPAKERASRANGLKGGRPRKVEGGKPKRKMKP